MRYLISCTFLLAVLLAAFPVNADVVRVPDDEEDIEGAIEFAEPGDTILVADGEYTGAGNCNLTLDFTLTILSENGPEDCIIDCENDHPKAFGIREQVVISGFTITNADTGLFALETEGVIIDNCIVTLCTSFGILLMDCNELTISNCELNDNDREEDQNGSAIRIDNSDGLIESCVIQDNSTFGSGAGIYMGNSQITINNTEILGNMAGTYGGGMLITNASDCTMSNCLIAGNRAEANNGGGIGITDASAIEMEQCILSENVTPQSGGGIYLSGSDASLRDVIFADNEVSRSGGGLLGYNNSDSQIINCIFTGNQAGIDGGGMAISVASVTEIRNCDFIANVAGTERNNGMGGGFYMGSDTNPVVINSIFWGNEADIGTQMYAQRAGEVNISFTCVQDGVNEEDNWEMNDLNVEEILEEDPQLTDGRDPEWGLNGFFLEEDSPCIDAGSGDAEEFEMNQMTTQVDFAMDEDAIDLGFHYSIDWFLLIGRLFGSVVDAENNEPLAGAMVMTSFGQAAQTDDEGAWEIPEAIAVRFDITASLDGYNPLTLEDRVLEENEELEINFRLLHPELSPSQEEFDEQLGVEDTVIIDFELTNTGNGPLNWAATTGLRGDEESAPWDLRYTSDVMEGIRGVIFTEECFIMTVSGEGDNGIILMSREGELLDAYEQPGDSEDGMMDLAWDGELLWGSGERTIYGFTLAGEVLISFLGPANTTVGLAWDSDRELLWACGSNGDIRGYNRDGERQATIQNPDLNIKGLAYWSGDPDDHNLYVYYDPVGGPRQSVTKVNTNNADWMDGPSLDDEAEGIAGGAFISSELFPMSYVLMTAPIHPNRNEGHIDAWQLDYKRDWMDIAPTEGTLEADEAEDLILTLRSTDFREGVYEAELIFTHNAVVGRTTLPITMEVTEGPVHTTKHITLEFGWGLYSVNLQPDERDIRVLTRELVDTGHLLMVKDQDGGFYRPSRNFYNMEGWSVEQGYWILMSQPGHRLGLEGTTVRADEPIELHEGWQMISYYPRFSMNAVVALSGIVDNLLLAKDGDGNFYAPVFDFNSMERCRMGHGYILRMADDMNLVWGGQHEMDLDGLYPQTTPKLPEYFTSIPTTTKDMSLLVLLPDDATGEIGVYAGERLVGSGIVQSGRCGIPVRGDNPFTSDIDGAIDAEALSLSWWMDGREITELNTELIQGKLEYGTNSLTAIRIEEVAVPGEFALYNVYPNPFNSTTKITYQLTKRSHVNLIVYDLFGREVTRLVNRLVDAGRHNVTFNANNDASGVYFVRLKTVEGVRVMKMMCLR